MINDILQKSKEEFSILGFNLNDSDKSYYCGFVLDFNTEFVIIQHFSKYGIKDGVFILKNSDIRYLETDTDYLNGLRYLISNQQKILNQTFVLGNERKFTDDFFSLFENFIRDKNYLIKFELFDGGIFYGFIEWCDENSFSVLNIDIDGLIIGNAIFKIEEIRSYWIDDLDSRKRLLLYKEKYIIN